MTLPQPATAAGREGLRALLADPADALVALDFDGTLSPIVARPRRRPGAPGRASGAASGWRRRGVRVAVVTGRPAQLAVDRGGLAGVAGLVVLGHYGLERWEGGTVTAPDDASPASPSPATGCPGCSASWGRPTAPGSRTRGAPSPSTPGGRPTRRRRSTRCGRRCRPWPRRPGWSSSPAGWCWSCGRPVPTRVPRCERSSRSVARPRSSSSVTTWATCRRSTRSSGCAPRACRGCSCAAGRPR